MVECSDPLFDLEHLTALAGECINKVGMNELECPHRRAVVGAFKGAFLIADAVLRLHPKSCYYVDRGPQVWNPFALQAFVRVIMEAAVNVHYFADDLVTEDERKFRTIIATLHYLREREDTAKSLEASRAAKPPVPNDWTGIPREEHFGLFAQMQRELIPKQIAYWEDELTKNPHFQRLPNSEQEKWLEGKGLFHKRTGRYIGGSSRFDAGFALKLDERAKRAGVSGPRYEALRRQFSTYVHTAPHALDQTVWFRSFDWVAMQSQIGVPIVVCVAYLALAIKWFLKSSPEYGDVLDASKAELLGRGLSYFNAVSPQSGGEQP